MQNAPNKPLIGITCGDLNGVGTELTIKAISDHRLLEFCTPVIFSSSKVINFYRKSITESNINYQIIKDFTRINPKQVNIFNVWEDEVAITPGQLTDTGGRYAISSLKAATEALKENKIQGLVTAPIHKKNTHSVEFPYTGHTPFLKEYFKVNDVLMLMVAPNMRVGLVTEHLPVKEVSLNITREKIISKLQVMNQSLIRDFGIDKPRIAVLGLNPHAGDEGLIGKEEEEVIRPAIKDAKHHMMVFGPYSADAFFAQGQFERFDGILAMYHDQGLIPFKSLAQGEGINYTAGLPVIRTSPDHGTAFDIAGKNKADAGSLLESIFTAVDIFNARQGFSDNRRNPLKKMTSSLLANAADERIEES